MKLAQSPWGKQVWVIDTLYPSLPISRFLRSSHAMLHILVSESCSFIDHYCCIRYLGTEVTVNSLKMIVFMMSKLPSVRDNFILTMRNHVWPRSENYRRFEKISIPYFRDGGGSRMCWFIVSEQPHSSFKNLFSFTVSIHK